MGENQEGQAREGLFRPKETFYQFPLSVDGMMGKEALVLLTNLSQIMAAKMDEPISHITGWVNGWIAIVVARSYYRVLRRALSPSPLRTWEPEWASGSGLRFSQ